MKGRPIVVAACTQGEKVEGRFWSSIAKYFKLEITHGGVKGHCHCTGTVM